MVNDGFDFAEQISLLAGQFHHLAAWEAPLQALYNNRPIFSNEDIPDEEPYIFDYGFDGKQMSDSLSKLGFILVKMSSALTR